MKMSEVAFAVSSGLACCIGNINLSSATSIDSNIKISGVYSAHSSTAEREAELANCRLEKARGVQECD